MALLPQPVLVLGWVIVAVLLPGMQTLHVLRERGGSRSQDVYIWAAYWVLSLGSSLAAGLLDFQSLTLAAVVRLLVSGVAQIGALFASALGTEEAHLIMVLWLVHPKTQGFRRLCLGCTMVLAQPSSMCENKGATTSTTITNTVPCTRGKDSQAASQISFKMDDDQDEEAKDEKQNSHKRQKRSSLEARYEVLEADDLLDALSPSKTVASDRSLPEPESETPTPQDAIRSFQAETPEKMQVLQAQKLPVAVTGKGLSLRRQDSVEMGADKVGKLHQANILAETVTIATLPSPPCIDSMESTDVDVQAVPLAAARTGSMHLANGDADMDGSQAAATSTTFSFSVTTLPSQLDAQNVDHGMTDAEAGAGRSPEVSAPADSTISESITQMSPSGLQNLDDSIQFDLTSSTLDREVEEEPSPSPISGSPVANQEMIPTAALEEMPLPSLGLQSSLQGKWDLTERPEELVLDLGLTLSTLGADSGRERLTALGSLPSTPEQEPQEAVRPQDEELLTLLPEQVMLDQKEQLTLLPEQMTLRQDNPVTLLPEELQQPAPMLEEITSLLPVSRALIPQDQQQQQQQQGITLNDEDALTLIPQQLLQSAAVFAKDASSSSALDEVRATMLPEQLLHASVIGEADSPSLHMQDLTPEQDRTVKLAAKLDESELQIRAGAVASVEKHYREELAALRSCALKEGEASPAQQHHAQSPLDAGVNKDCTANQDQSSQLVFGHSRCNEDTPCRSKDEDDFHMSSGITTLPDTVLSAASSPTDKQVLDDMTPKVSLAEAHCRARRFNGGKTLKRIQEINAAREARRAALKAKQQHKSQAQDVTSKAVQRGHRYELEVSQAQREPEFVAQAEHSMNSPPRGQSEEEQSEGEPSESEPSETEPSEAEEEKEEREVTEKGNTDEDEDEVENQEDDDEEEEQKEKEVPLREHRARESLEVCNNQTFLPGDFFRSRYDGQQGQMSGRRHCAASENSTPRSVSTECSSADITAGAKQRAQRSSGGRTLGKIEEIKAAREARRAALEAKRQGRQLLLKEGVDPEMARFVEMLEEWREKHVVPTRDAHLSPILVDRRILVCVRKRPLNEKELTKGAVTDFVTVQPGGHVVMHEPGRRVDRSLILQHWPFKFDVSFDENASNEEVFAATAQGLVDAVVEEEASSTMFAYGQTGSGKTFSMAGADGIRALQAGANQEARMLGMYQLSALYLFGKLDELERPVLVTVSFIEIYGPKVRDLLDNRREVRLMEDGHGRTQVLGAKEATVSTAAELCGHIVRGSQLRVSKKMIQNQESSRSHAVLSVQLYARREAGRDRLGRPCGRFSLVDLAGNERGADNQAASSEARVESAEINKSLLALKECIRSLARGRPDDYTPFRQSKLTTLLRESFLNPRARVCVLNCISPGSCTSEYTLNTLRYASMLKQI